MGGPPNIVLFMTDQQRHDQLGYASGGHFETPNLDALARRGVVFDCAYSTSTVCVPSRVGLLTGLQHHRVPTQENPYALREGFWTVARELARAGYETALIGKMHFAPIHSDHGFETMRLCEHLSAQGLGPLSEDRGDVTDDYHHWLVDQGLADWREGRVVQGAAFPHDPGVHPTTWVAREAEALLDRRDRGRPLLLIVSFPHPHAPYNPPEPYASMYDPEHEPLPSDGFEVNGALPIPFQLALRGSPTRGLVDRPGALAQFLSTVRGLIAQIDDAIGAVLQRIDLDDTAVFFTSDHGDYAGHRGLYRKTPWMPFDDLARVPLFAAGAGIDGGRQVSAPVQSSDLALTWLDLAGVTPPDLDFDSRSLGPILSGASPGGDADRAVFCATTVGWPMVRRGRFKYVVHAAKQVGALFDLEADPGERVNLARSPEHADTVAELAAVLREQLALGVVDA